MTTNAEDHRRTLTVAASAADGFPILGVRIVLTTPPAGVP
jgi:hypothetical protein